MSKSSLTQDMIDELKSLEDSNGNLQTEEVVEFAKNPRTALHDHPAFEWDVEKAAHSSWMESARSIIQVYVEIIPCGDGSDKEMRGYVSIVEDSGHRTYRPTKKVLRENRTAVINLVLDRIISAIASYPLAEFDPILELVDQLRPRPPRGRRSASPAPRPRGPRRGGAEARV